VKFQSSSSVSDLAICPIRPLNFFFPAELVKAIESVVPRVVDMLKDRESLVRYSAVSALGEFSKQCK